MTGSGKTGLGIALIEEAAIDGLPVLAIDPKGDLANLMLTFPGLSAQEFLPWVNPDEARAQQLDPGGVRREGSRALEGRPGGVGPGRRAHRPAQGRRRRHRLHAGQPRRPASVDPRDLQSAAARGARRAGTARRARAIGGDEPARPGRRLGRGDDQPRTRAGLNPAPGGVARRRDARPRRAHRPGAGTADDEGRRAGTRSVLPGLGPLRAGHETQQRAGRAGLRHLARRRPARHREAALHIGGQAADRGRLDRAPRRRRADVLRGAAARAGAGVDALRSAAPRRCARCSTWTSSSDSCRRPRIRRARCRC